MSSAREAPVAIALGSNLGDRAARIAEAIRRLRDAEVLVERVSDMYETAPVGFGEEGPRIPWFLNAVCVGRTSRSPAELLAALKRLEREMGREEARGLAPRTIDLDLILYDARIVRRRDLHVPHPRFRERAFVLVPLREIAPEWPDPVTRRTVGELADALGPPGATLRLYGPAPSLAG